MGRRPGADRTEENHRWNTSSGKVNAQLKTRYGITIEDYQRMLEEQNGVCFLCQETCQTKQRLSVDHCHTTGQVRGLLCRRCNAAIGCEERLPGWLERAILYMKGGGANVL